MGKKRELMSDYSADEEREMTGVWVSVDWL